MPRGALPRSPRARIVAAAIAAVAVAELAVLLLSPDNSGPRPIDVAASTYFEPAELERAADYRGGQRTLLLGGIALELGALGLLAAGRPRRLLAGLRRPRRPLAAAAAAGAGIALLLALVVLPVGAVAHERAVDFGLSTQDLGGWLWDRARSTAIAALFAAIGALLLVALQRRAPRRWWLAGAGAVVGFAAVTSFLAPVLLSPIFNDFDRLPPGALREDVLELADRAGVQVDDVYRVDASRRVTSLNAYVDGIGSTRRVVLFDNLIEESKRPELRSVVAHELAHVEGNDIPRGILFVAIVAPLGVLFVKLAGDRLAGLAGRRPGGAAAVPAYALALSVAALVLTVPGNQLSRAVEERADRFAIELTGDPAALIELQLRLARTNLSEPDPPSWYQATFRTHPSTMERIGLAEAYLRLER